MKETLLFSVKNPVGSWLFLVVFSLLLTGIVAPLAVWISIERNDILYETRKLQAELEIKKELAAKLEVERGRLLSPYELEKKADILGMAMADPGQVRRLTKENLLKAPTLLTPIE